ncbi:hypothetical protein V1478_018322 [Vespula squamosa]|uniref:Uncharacterized protein n=1 Tax=Vespula squamosa TaxID=30214 RepID=A0ABD1ZVE0_VESSQ
MKKDEDTKMKKKKKEEEEEEEKPPIVSLLPLLRELIIFKNDEDEDEGEGGEKRKKNKEIKQEVKNILKSDLLMDHLRVAAAARVELESKSRYRLSEQNSKGNNYLSIAIIIIN